MNLNTHGLSLKQSLAVITAVITWLTIFTFIVRLSPNLSPIYPAVWLFSSAVLLLVGLTYKLTPEWQQTLAIRNTQILRLLMAVILGIIYWKVDQWIQISWLGGNMQNDIAQWQANTATFHSSSLLISSVLLAPLFEELFFRGLILNALKQASNGFIAALISSLLFAMIHWSVPDFLSLFIIGMIYSALTLKSKSILPAILAHSTHNALTFWLYAAV